MSALFPMAAPNQTAALSVLVIDDFKELRRAIRTALEYAGYQVSEANNGREAANLLIGTKFDLVITDILMPQRDGFEFILDARKVQPDVPIIVMTGGGPKQANYYLQLASDLGAKSVLHKPFSNDELMGAINKALAKTPA